MIFRGIRREIAPSPINAMTATKMLRKGCQGYLAFVVDKRQEGTRLEDIVTPQTRGSIDFLSTRGIQQVVVGLPDATSENQAESPLYGELYPNTTPA